MRPQYAPYEATGKDMYEAKAEEQAESKRSEENGKDVQLDAFNDEAEIIKAVKEELEATNILKGVAICESSVDGKLGKALNKFIQLYAPNHIDSTLKQSANLHNIS